MVRRRPSHGPDLRRSGWTLLMVLAAMGLTCALASPARAELANNTLSRVRAQSHIVVVGFVRGVVSVPVTRKPSEYDGQLEFTKLVLAEVEVKTWLKGRSAFRSVWVLATATYQEDLSQAKVGERAVFFLDGQGVSDLVDAPSVARVAKATGGRGVHRIAWLGRGRMPIESIQGEPFATLWYSDVRPPSDMDTLPGPDPRFRDFERMVRVSDLAAFVRDGEEPVSEVPASVVGALELWDRAFGERARFHAAVDAIGERALPHLRRILENERSPLRENAAMALACLDEVGGEALMRWLGSETPSVRRAAAFAAVLLAWGGGTPHDEAFEKARRAALRGQDPVVRRRILRSIAVSGSSDEELLRARLPAALASSDRMERIDAARLAGPIASWYLEPGEGAEADAARKALRARARSTDVWERRAVWEALSGCAGPAARESALAALKDPDRVVRSLAVSAFVRSSRDDDAPHVKRLITHEDPWVRRATAFGLMARKSPLYVETLVGRLRDDDERTRTIAVAALGALGPRAAAAVPALEKARDVDPDGSLAYAIRKALEWIEKR